MTERTVARVAPDTTNGVVVNIEVVASDWTNDDPTHLIEYDAENPAGIGWQVVNRAVIRPYVQEDLPDINAVNDVFVAPTIEASE